MSGFSFPPPPPPPPKPVLPQQNSQNRGGPRGRGGFRGDHSQRGRSESHVRGNHSSNAAYQSGYFRRGGAPNEYHQNNFASASNQSWPNLPQAQPGFQNQALPAGAFINPNFAGTQSSINGNQRSAYGDNRHAASPNFDASFGTRNNDAQSPPRTTAGHKRKLDALRGGAPREKKPGPPTAPSVPSFGASNLPAKPDIPANAVQPKASDQPKMKPVGRSLGLTPGTDDPRYPSSESEDEGPEVDEEAAHAELGNKLTFEHNGVLMSLNSQADLVAWKRERRKNWPTRERKAEKYKERQKVGEERKRLLASSRSLAKPLQRKDRPRGGKRTGSFKAEAASVAGAEDSSLQNAAQSDKPETELEKARRELEERTKQLEQLRRRVADSEAKNREARARQSLDTPGSMANKIESKALAPEVITPSAQETEAIDADVKADEADEEVSQASDNSSPESSSVISSDSSSAEDSDDERPEEIASKPPIDPTPSRPTPVCRYFSASGYCRDGNACRFKHEGPSKQPSGFEPQQHRNLQKQQPGFNKLQPPGHVDKKGIFERLLEQEQAEHDKLALKVIKYLGSVGFFKEVTQGADERE